MISVVMTYDEKVKKWDSFVSGAVDATEAKQAFNAAVLTMHLIREEDLTRTTADQLVKDHDVYRITPFGLNALGL